MIQTDTAFLYLAAMQKPDFHTIRRFRSTHLDAIKDIFSQIVTLCKAMGLISSSISIDGTKVKASASSRQSKSSDTIEKRLTKYSGKALRPINVKTKFMVIPHHTGCQKNWLTKSSD
jgi:transposase